MRRVVVQELAEEVDGRPDRLVEDDLRRRRHDDADEADEREGERYRN